MARRLDQRSSLWLAVVIAILLFVLALVLAFSRLGSYDDTVSAPAAGTLAPRSADPP